MKIFKIFMTMESYLTKLSNFLNILLFKIEKNVS